MTKIPTRLVVIQARIPTGESCFENGERCELLDASERCGISGEDTDGYRLPACRERDGWAAVKGDALEELRGRLLDLDHYSHQYISAREAKQEQWYTQTESDMVEARKEAIEASRKVAEVER